MKRTLIAATLSLLTLPAFAMSEADCAKRFAELDTNKDGILSFAEGGRYYAAERIRNVTLDDGKLTKDIFMKSCTAKYYDEAKNDEGAPLKGANSFTEAQAKDRAVARGYTDVSALTKDADGIWRGTAKHGAKSHKIAIDFKGNVVAN